MRAAVDGIDIVGKTEDRFRVTVVVLERDFHLHSVALGFHVDRLVMEDALAAVQVLDELRDPARVLELQAFGFAGFGVGVAFVGQRDLQALVQEGQLAQALGQRVEVVLGDGENLFVGKEVDFGAALLGVAGLAQLAVRAALGVSLLPDISFAPDFEVQLMAERIHARDANAVQSA